MKNNSEEKKLIFNFLVSVAQVFRDQKINHEGLVFYTEMLSEELTFLEIKTALTQIAKTKKEPFFPTIAEIIEKAKPKLSIDEQANVLANEIIRCISDYGPYQVEAVRKHLGENFWVAERFGWANLCQITNDEVPTIRAQLRELSKAHLSAKTKGFTVDVKSIGDGQKGGLKRVSFDEEIVDNKFLLNE